MPVRAQFQEMLENLSVRMRPALKNEMVDFKRMQIQYGVYSEQFEMSINDMRNKLLSSETPVIEYSVKEEDSVSTIASSFQVDGNTIQNLNPNVDLDNLDTDSRILVPSSQPMLSVIVRRTVSYVEEIPMRPRYRRAPICGGVWNRSSPAARRANAKSSPTSSLWTGWKSRAKRSRRPSSGSLLTK